MKKIPTLFKRTFDTRPPVVYDAVTEGCEWVQEGQGVATRKYDGTCCMIRGGQVYKRYDAKVYIPGNGIGNGLPVKGDSGLFLKKPLPEGFEPADVPDAITGHWPGWVLVDPLNPADRWHVQAMENNPRVLDSDGTYELCGPKIGANPEGFDQHVFIPHGSHVIAEVPTTFAGLSLLFREFQGEGIVWHHPDGRMAKLRVKDFRGLK